MLTEAMETKFIELKRANVYGNYKLGIIGILKKNNRKSREFCRKNRKTFISLS